MPGGSRSVSVAASSGSPFSIRTGSIPGLEPSKEG